MEQLKILKQSCQNAADISQKRLLSILKDNAGTEYGIEHHFSEIRSISDYKKQIPFSVFDDYKESVDRMMRGENLLQPQTFALYRDVQIWNGASPNQLKLIHVITNAKTEAFFRGLES